MTPDILCWAERQWATGARFARFVVGGPPFIYLLLFFALPGLIMVAASFMLSGEFGGLARCFPDRQRRIGLTVENYRVFWRPRLF
jgi:spermidine/putrescine transport system permease protein